MEIVTQHLKRRSGDHMITKVLKFWPVIVAMAGMIVGYTTLNNTVNWNVRKIRSHEKRIAKVKEIDGKKLKRRLLQSILQSK